MKKLIIGFLLLTTSFGAQAFFSCKFKILKPMLFNQGFVASSNRVNIEHDSKYTIDDYLVTSIAHKTTPYKSAFWFNGSIGCNDEGFCKLEGVLSETLYKILIDGTAEYVSESHKEHDKIKITKDQSHDAVIVNDNGKKTVVRIECN